MSGWASPSIEYIFGPSINHIFQIKTKIENGQESSLLPGGLYGSTEIDVYFPSIVKACY